MICAPPPLAGPQELSGGQEVGVDDELVGGPLQAAAGLLEHRHRRHPHLWGGVNDGGRLQCGDVIISSNMHLHKCKCWERAEKETR